MTYEISGVHIYSMTNYYFIVKTDAVDQVAAVTNSDLMNQLADKVDPALLDAVNCAAEAMCSGSVA